MRTLCLAPVVLGGCSSIFGLAAPQHLDDANGPGDGAHDAHDALPGQDAMPDAAMCFGSGTYRVCLTALPSQSVALTGTVSTADTATCSTAAHWVAASQPDVCFIVGASISANNVTAVGTRPIVLVATGSISFSGTFDVSSHRIGPVLGAGFRQTGCDPATPAVLDVNGGGGGAGGTFGTIGGNGGTGRPGATGAQAATVGTIDVLSGGCFGSAGARGGGAGNAGIPGPGGGALYAVAGTSIMLGSAVLAANGGGAGNPTTRWGGPGGGSGGMIVLHAPVITSSNAFLVANGGGGAAGADAATQSADPDLTRPLIPAAGGTSSNGGNGGTGYAAGNGATVGTNTPGGNTGGGGGGGGGAGYIRANVAIATATASPPIDIVP